MAATFDIKEHTIPASHIREYPRGTAVSQDEQLSLHVKQYVPKDNLDPQKGDITVIGAHANGFPKELYEPLWEDFYAQAKQRHVRIRGIWILDAAWQGQSGVLNEGKLGNDPGWLDAARDIQHMINTFRMPRPLVAIGHSFGGDTLTNVALSHPRLFTTMVLLDPVISRFTPGPDAAMDGPAAMSLYRRDAWPSRAAAAQSFGKSAFYRAWDPRVLDRWIKYGVRALPGHEDGEVRLTTTKHQELFTFLRPSWPGFDAKGESILHPELIPDLDNSNPTKHPAFPVYRPESPNTLTRLPHLRPSVLFVFGTKSYLSTPQLREQRMRLTGSGLGGSGGAKMGRVKQVTAPHGHLVPMEAPSLCAEAAADWVKSEMDRWWKEEREYEAWARKPLIEKTTMSPEWREIFPPQERAPKTGSKI